MKNQLITAFSFLGVLLVAVPLLADSEVTALQQKDDGKEIRLQAGSIIELSLEESGGTGYVWEFDRLDEKHFEVVQTETRPLAEKARIGAPLLKTWRLQTKKAGDSQLKLDYFRPWEGRAKAVKHYLVKVRVQ